MMKQTTLLLVLLLCIASTGVAARGQKSALMVPQGRLTLDEAWKAALDNYPGIQEARQRIDAARAVLKQAKSAYLPTVTAQGGIKALDVTGQPDWNPYLRVDDSYNEMSLGIRLTWLLFDGFSREANTLAAIHGVELRKERLADTRRLLLKAVATAYYQAQLAVEGMVVAKQNQEFNQILEKDARIKWQVGAAPEAEMLNFSVKALQAESDFQAAERDFKIVCAALAQLMALPEAHLPEDLYPVRITKKGGSPLETFESDYQFALAHRPDLKALDAGVLAQEQLLRAEKGNCYPDIALITGGGYMYEDDKTVKDQEEHETYVGVVASWDLYTGGLRTGKIREVNAELRALTQQRKQLLLAMGAAIRQSRDRAETAFETYERQKLTLELTQRIREHVATAYRAGALPLTRLNQAQTDLVRASGAVALTWIQYRIALVNLAAETGRINLLPDSPPSS
ncbi:MAG: TolC family protein [Desulfobacteraceae bacterium]|nr:TolC family protein [Desulfobacteraceae bacterium]